MRFGSTGFHPDAYKEIKASGLDYVELPFFRVNALNDEEFETLVAQLDALDLKGEVCNGFFPPDFVLYAYDNKTGKEDIDGFKQIEENVRAYVKKGYQRVSRVGCNIVVIGSGKARAIKEDMDREVAIKQFSRVLVICAEEAEKFGITVTVEPLNPNEVNFINTLADSLDIVEALNHPNIKAMVDFFHEGKQGDPTTSLERAGDKLIHTHIARVEDRTSCSLADADYFTPVFKKLKEIGYDYRVSLEGTCVDGVKIGLKAMKEFFDYMQTV